MTLMMSSVMVVYRRYPEAPAAGPNVLSSIFLLPLSLIFVDPFDAPLHEILIMAAFGLIFAFASGRCRKVPAAWHQGKRR
jgi:hypothetical protein